MAVNGPVCRVLVENCRYGTVHSMLTLGSESLHDTNVILRNCVSENADRVLWLKMRPDTPQRYEQIRVEGVTGRARSVLVIRPWTQFFQPAKRRNMPKSMCRNVTLKNIQMDCDNFFDVGTSDKYSLSDFTFEDIRVTDKAGNFSSKLIPGTLVRNVVINGEALK